MAATPIPIPPTPWRDAMRDGEELLRQRRAEDAVEAYYHALRLASESDPPAPPFEIARLCQRLGTLQAQFGSGAEARATLLRGRTILQNLKVKDKSPSDDTTRLLGDIDAALKRLPAD
jgi:hypothetical protein